MALREDKMGQCQALPTSIRDLIPDDHIVNLVIAVVNTVDLKDKFEYEEEKDWFVCPDKEILVRKGEYEYNGKPLYAYYGANCGECPFGSECAGEGKTRVITSDGYEGNAVGWLKRCTQMREKRRTKSVRRPLNGLSR